MDLGTADKTLILITLSKKSTLSLSCLFAAMLVVAVFLCVFATSLSTVSSGKCVYIILKVSDFLSM